MAPPIGQRGTRFRRPGSPQSNRSRDEYELYEEEGGFALTVELPGFETEEITLTWDDGVLNVAAEHDGDRDRRTFHRRFRFPKAVDDDAIEAEYDNGILEVWLPLAGQSVTGTEIEVEG